MSKIALLIGVSEFDESDLKPLPSAEEDIKAMARVLQQPELGGFDQVQALTNPTRGEVEDAIYALFANRQRDDLLLFYFSGHGVRDESGRLFLATPSTRKDGGKLVGHTAIAASVLHENMNNSRSDRQVLVFDCCFSGAIATGMTIKDDGSVAIQQQLGGKGRAIFTSSNSIEYSFHRDEFKLSVYTHFWVEGIEKGVADRDGDGWVSADELHEYVSDKVKTAAPAMTPQFFPVQAGHKILLAKSLPQDDPQLRYRKEVEKRIGSFRVENDRFSIPAKKALETLRLRWKLDLQTAGAIEAEVLQPIRERQRKLQEYEQTLLETMQEDGFPFTEMILSDLRDCQMLLGLRDEDVAAIEARALPSDQPLQLTEVELPAELPTEPVADDLSSERGVDYTQLRDLLATGKWKEADRETYRLMITTVGRTESDYFREEDLLNFPCTDLQTLDRLWVKYSKGHFGFSVQKEIYVEAGNPLDGKYHKETFDLFADRVGWKVKWQDYDQLDFSFSSPRGNLPLQSPFGGLVVSSLAQRLVNCSTSQS